MSEEHKKNISNALKGRISPRKGAVMSEETKRKIGLANSVALKGKKMSFETREKIAFALLGRERPNTRGERAHNWIKDRTKVKRRDKKDGSLYIQWRKDVYKRDGWKCKMLNGECVGRIEAHHILPWRDYPELRYDINNGITLCYYHHPRKRIEEETMSPYFKSLIECH